MIAEAMEAVSTRRLPSIYELISKAHIYTAPTPPPAFQQPSSSFPSSFSGHQRSYDADKYASSQVPHPGNLFSVRRDLLPFFNQTNSNGRIPHTHHRATIGACRHPLVAAPPTSNSNSSETLPQAPVPLPSGPLCPSYEPPQHESNHVRCSPKNHMDEGEKRGRPSFEASIHSSPWPYSGTSGRVS